MCNFNEQFIRSIKDTEKQKSLKIMDLNQLFENRLEDNKKNEKKSTTVD